MNGKKIKDFAKKQPVALGCIFLSIALLAAIYYRRDALPGAEADLNDKTAEAEHINDNKKNAEQLDEQFAALTHSVEAMETRLVHADRLAINLQYFYKLESETKTKLTDLRQTGTVNPTKLQSKKGPSKKNNYAGIGYTVSVQGSYLQLMDFLRRIEDSEHLSRVDDLTLTHAGGGETTANSADLSLRLDLELLGVP